MELTVERELACIARRSGVGGRGHEMHSGGECRKEERLSILSEGGRQQLTPPV